MSEKVKQQITIRNYLGETLSVGEPDVSGPLAVYPIFGAVPVLEYISMSKAHARGLTIKELPGGASVRDLIVSNPLDVPVLLFEGEEVLGAQQNRTLDKSVLVPAGAEVRVPVSCVEAGRWDGSRHRENLGPSPQTTHPELRAKKARQAHRARMMNLEERADQGEVWNEVGDRSAEMNVTSRTGSMHEIYEKRRVELRQMADSIRLHEGQIGTVVQIADGVKAFDLVSLSDVFADLHEPLVQGYCLDALPGRSRRFGDATNHGLGGEFLDKTLTTRILEADGIGLGRDFRFESASLVGSGLVSGDELIQLSVFAGKSEEAAGEARSATRTRIRRPSSRRGR